MTEPTAARPGRHEAPHQVPRPAPTPARVELADQVAAAVLTVRGVTGLHGGMFGETATYLPGRRVPGVRLTEDVTDIHLTLTYGAPVFATAQQVRTAVAALVPGPVNVTVEDVAPPTDTPTAATN
jgi:uncharacterized alkaline shock family protein YloU